MYLAELSFLFLLYFNVCSWYVLLSINHSSNFFLGICTKSHPLRTSFLMKLVLGQNKCIVEEAVA